MLCSTEVESLLSLYCSKPVKKGVWRCQRSSLCGLWFKGISQLSFTALVIGRSKLETIEHRYKLDGFGPRDDVLGTNEGENFERTRDSASIWNRRKVFREMRRMRTRFMLGGDVSQSPTCPRSLQHSKFCPCLDSGRILETQAGSRDDSR